MPNKRVLWLLILAVILFIARVVVSFDDVGSPKTFFNMGRTDFQLDTPESRKLGVLQSHPILALTRSSRSSDPSSGKEGAYRRSRNPFLFGKPIAPKRFSIVQPDQAPIETVVQVESEVQQRFSGELFGFVERAYSGIKTVSLKTEDEILLLKESELIDNRYMIKQITRVHVIIVDTQSGQELILSYEE